MLTVVLVLAAILLVVTLIVVFRKVDKLPLPRMGEPHKPRGAGLIADELDDFPIIGGANQARMRRQTTRTGTVYQPPAPVATADDLSNVITLVQLQQPEPVADATREYAVPITPEPCHTPASHDSHHAINTSSHCHSSDTGSSGGGFDGGGHGGHH